MGRLLPESREALARRGEVRGANGSLFLSEAGVTVTRKLPRRVEIRVNFGDLEGVQFKRAGVAPGFLRIVSRGRPARLSVLAALRDDQTVVFGWLENRLFERAWAVLSERVADTR